MTKRQFRDGVITYASSTGASYMEAVIDFCTNNDIPLEDASKFVDSSLKEKIKSEAQSLNMVTKDEDEGDLEDIFE